MEEPIENLMSNQQSWQVMYPKLAARICAFLDANPDKEFSTTAIAHHLWPKDKGDTPARLWQALKAVRKHGCADYVKEGPMKTRGLTKGHRAVVWSAPKYDL